SNTVTASGVDDDGDPVSGQGSATVTIANVNPSITVVKSANPTGVPSGGSVQYTVRIDNTSNSQDPVTITSLSDNRFGNLNGQGTCSTPRTIQPGTSYSCTFTKSITGSAGGSHVNTVTASGTDNEGTAVSGQGSATVVIMPGAPCPASVSGWAGEYWNNPTLSGIPTLCRDDPILDFDWWNGSPSPLIPVDQFSARWTDAINFPVAGTYRFTMWHDDGVRLYVDGALRFENWCDHCRVEDTVDVVLTSGVHAIVMAMWENDGAAGARLTYTRLVDTATTEDTLPELVEVTGDSPQDLIIITNTGARVRWLYNGQQGQGQSNPVSNPATHKQLYLPVIIRQR
ncbi:MAG TPA: PA14 domain-containing protein, partial [Anaerolineae bacterium]|nr:PA14 domain-containing protein [Anaerolineae bacterium]